VRALALLLLFSCAQVEKAPQPSHPKVRHGVVPLTTPVEKKIQSAQLNLGKALYRQHCLACHGEKGQGDGFAAKTMQPKPANLQQLVREVRDFKFFMSISQWEGEMPGWKEPFNEADREALVIYLKTFR
jgi:mono/diheme cytochrome c family protein